ncbi:MAG: bis(5'-nucleosyl)-tetraphosphatase (symmetrical) YqeK [Actinomycetia bacterium]|nr:bis(5'-nucleosyl)-tetraphosphatase (symmetrical) YqeK [Actinomycetes bacterium]
MDPPLFSHSINTLEFAVKMAGSYEKNINLFDLCISSVVHDYGKTFDPEELIRLVKKHKLDISEFELGLKPLLHGLIGDFLIARDFGIKNTKIQRAVKYHTIGSVNMSPEEKILFIADKVEKGRKYEKAEELRRLALKNINLCLIEVYKNTIIYVINKNGLLHPDTSGIWNSICGGVINYVF